MILQSQMTTDSSIDDQDIIMNERDVIIAAIAGGYHLLCNKFEFNDQEIEFDYIILTQVVERFLSDKQRITAHHGINLVDCHKVAGYLTYWICKLRPLQVRNFDIYEHGNKRYVRFINEILAFTVGTGMIISELQTRQPPKQLSMPKQCFVNAYLYTLRFRTLNPDLLAMVYYFIDELSMQ